MNYQTDVTWAQQMDRSDPLASFRSQFHLPKNSRGKEQLYFCGHSLGLQPKGTKKLVEQELNDWATLGVEGHFKPQGAWLSYHELVSGSLARLTGAKPLEVVAMNSLSVNLHLMMVSFYRPTAQRYKILIEESAFPSDHYAVESQIRFHGHQPENALLLCKPRSGEPTIRTEDIRALLEKEGGNIALVMLGGVRYITGQAFEMESITKAAQAQGCSVGFDLAHAIGNIPLALHDWNVDFAVWCSYKYLNSGPGGIAGCFVHERHAENTNLPRFAGWWGHDKATRFLMRPEFKAIAGAEGWQLSNPPILQLASLRASLELFDAAGMPALRKKSELLTGYFEFLLQSTLPEKIALITPTDSRQRGCQLSLLIKNRSRDQARAIYESLLKNDCICDWREPAVIRATPIPLYNTFSDVHRFVELLRIAYEENESK